MKKLIFLMLVLTVLATTPAKAESKNFCGLYYDKNGQGFLSIPREDLGVGRRHCSHNSYNSGINSNGEADIALDFTKKRSVLGDWKKFSGHLIEIRGKMQNGYISNVRLVRDFGEK